jgi:PAS domain S-box-containing protein
MNGWLAQNVDYLAFLALVAALWGALWVWRRRRKCQPGMPRVLVFMVMAVLLAGWFIVDRAGREAQTGTREKIELLLPLYALEFERLGHAQVPTDSPPGLPAYGQLIKTQIHWQQLNPFIADIYTFRRLNDDRLVVVVDSETDYDHDGLFTGEREQRTRPGTLFISHTAARDRALAGQNSFDDRIYPDLWGSWISAYVPLHDATGRVEAVLGVDVEAAQWRADIWKARLPWISFLGVLVIILLGSATLIALLQHDLQERTRTERQLREQGEMRRMLFDQAPGGVVLCDLQLRLLEVNEAFCHMLGYTREELLQLTINQISHPDDLQKTQEGARRVATGQIDLNLMEKRYVRKDGSILDAMVSVGLIRDENNTPKFLVGHITDVTKRRRAESELQLRQKQLDTILANTPVILFVVDPQGTVTFSEGAGLASIGSKPGQSVGKSFYDRYAARPDIIADARRALAGEVFAAQRELNGAVFETHYTPIRDAGGKVSGMIGIGFEITERGKSRRERERMERQMLDMQKLESLGVLAGGVAHDFNNLLTSILGNASLARLALGEASPVLYNLGQIEQASQTAASLCQQLLAYSGRGRLDTSEIDLGSLIQESTDLLRLSVGNQVRLQFEFAPQLPTIMADPAQVRQVLLNLVLNASEAVNRRDGVIQITTGLLTVDAAWLAGARIGQDIRPGEYVGLEISDNGPGLSVETQARIFDPFFSTKAKGRGLGLAAALGIMRSHQGALHLWSQAGQGTKFSLAFPPHGQRAPQKEPVADGRNWRGRGRILIVDDEEAVRATAAQMTAYYGFEVRQASSGQQALEFVRESPTPFNLVLLDLTMPGMDGFATFSAIRQLRPDQRIVVFSGYSEQDAKKRFAGQNLTGFLQKPFSADALRDVLRLAG